MGKDEEGVSPVFQCVQTLRRMSEKFEKRRPSTFHTGHESWHCTTGRVSQTSEERGQARPRGEVLRESDVNNESTSRPRADGCSSSISSCQARSTQASLICKMASISIVGTSSRVVDAPGLTIDELAGNIASNEDRISIAHVK